ncbi:hypothetical protein COD90_20800 [Bacillus cereus]|nr:hypothetical protein CN338_27280 [Bacillus cereus]PFM06168.1 hypothetical protein COJ40_23380 [Bacillus cereus]PGS12089.1 hypothetical protein COC45_12320 [Bacillus cereus]PGW12693.1 hypothetical protein COD90_20800 [Bacillus cereus]RFB14523.1 hypothetical protein DZB88_11665 [Bacillus sp. OE]
MQTINCRYLYLQCFFKNSSIYFLNIFLKIYLANTNECLPYNLRFNKCFEYDVSIHYIPI